MSGAASPGILRTLAVAALCFVLGGGTVYWFTRRPAVDRTPVPGAPAHRSSAPAALPPAAGQARLADVVVPVDPTLAGRAGLAIEPVGQGRATATVAQLREEGVDVTTLHVPAGHDLGGKGPGEIALSVVAEIVAESYDRPGGALRD